LNKKEKIEKDSGSGRITMSSCKWTIDYLSKILTIALDQTIDNKLRFNKTIEHPDHSIFYPIMIKTLGFLFLEFCTYIDNDQIKRWDHFKSII
jgi:hypothetical protein